MKKFINRVITKVLSIRVLLLRNISWSALGAVVLTWLAISTAQYFVERNVEGKNIGTLEDSIWWGIVTMLTVGYGDKYPVSTLGRILAGILMVVGVVGIAIVTAKISSYFLERALRERRGYVDSSALNKHVVICGWKNEMIYCLLHILESNPDLKSENVVLLNNAPDNYIEQLLAEPRLSKIKIVRGDFFVEVNLRRVAPERSRKIIILADATPNAVGEIPTITEADARTVMTAMTLNNIAKGVAVAAEILDSQMEQYLRLAHVNEIIYSRDYSRFLVAMASTGTGITNIFHELMNPKSPHFIGTMDIPQVMHDKSYAQLSDYFEKNHSGKLLIGVLENSGNSFVAKEKALKKAQKTANVSELVKNLQMVKAIKFNQPNLCPPRDFIVSEGDMAIVIEHRGIQLNG